jgi:hypothetical protein
LPLEYCALKKFILNDGKDCELIVIYSDGEFKSSKNLDLLVEFQKETTSVLIWNFFASNHGASVCDADINQAQTFLKNYVQNNDISLFNKLPLISNLIDQIKNHESKLLELANTKYSSVQKEKFKGMIH